MATESSTGLRQIAVSPLGMTYVALLCLLAASFIASSLVSGSWHLGVVLCIAAVKALLIGAVFMDIRRNAAIINLVLLTMLIWGTIFAALSFSDYLTRGFSLNPETSKAGYSPHPGGDSTVPARERVKGHALEGR